MEKLIFTVPTVTDGMLFTKEVLIFIGVIFVLIIGLITALLGFRCLKTILFLLFGVGGGTAGYLIAERLTEQP